jgi:hypothetical protein
MQEKIAEIFMPPRLAQKDDDKVQSAFAEISFETRELHAFPDRTPPSVQPSPTRIACVSSMTLCN